jgi:pimeloyl-ACP methyl ester carboxylesterase
VSERIIKIGGRSLAYQEYGDPAGAPVFFFHGWPSSRTMAELTDTAAKETAVRIISPDRPGISRSEFAPGRKLLDWPPVVTAMADHLEIDRFHILAISGGAPYAYAAGWAIPQRIKAMAIVSGAPPLFELTDHTGLLPLYRWMLTVYRNQPGLVRFGFHVARPLALMGFPIRLRPILLKLLQPCDAESLRDSAAFNACFESQRKAWRGSAMGVMTDARIYGEPWGFPLEEVAVPVRLWHGKKDRSFSPAVAQEVAARLPNGVARYVENAGHYSLPIRNMPEILRDLLTAGS